MEISTIRKEDFVLTFESRGTTFLFEELCVSYYMNWESLTLGESATVEVYVPHKEIERLREAGRSLVPSDITERVHRLEKVVTELEAELPNLKAKEILDKKDVEHLFRQLAEMMSAYSYFDIQYSDGLWASIDERANARAVIDLIQKYKNEVRDMFNMPFLNTDGSLLTVLGKLHIQFAVSIDVLNWYRETEILALFDGELVSKEIIRERQESYALCVDGQGKRMLYSGGEAKELNQRLKAAETSTSEIRGVVAHGKGRSVQGKVKIVRRDYGNPQVLRDSMGAMNQGDILVSESTDPDLMEALKKAGAIITDIGGMLSHAAITARELDTLCIVGTKIATKVLKDGDSVEVDANTGTVTLIK